MKKVDLLGTPPQTLCEAPARNRSGTWNRDGVILFAGDNGPIQRVSASGGPAQPVTELDNSRGETAHLRPYFLPDGKHFVFLAVAAKPENMAMFVGSLDSKDRTLVMASDIAAVFAPPHHLLFLRQRTLMTQEFDADRLELRGDPRPVAERVQMSAFGAGGFSASDNGILTYRGGAFGDDGRQLSTVDRNGKLIEAFGTTASYQNPVLSVDQQLVAFNRADQNNDIWIEDMVRRTTSRLTFDPGIDDFPLWSPDGARIVFSSNREGGVFNLYEKPSGGGGQEQLLLKTGQPKMTTDWSRDGRYVVYTETDAKSGADIWLLPPTADNQFMAVDILSQPADAVFKAGVPKKLFVVNVVTAAVPGGQPFQRNSYEVLKDGQRLLLNSSRAALALDVRPSITVVLNWAAGLGK